VRVAGHLPTLWPSRIRRAATIQVEDSEDGGVEPTARGGGLCERSIVPRVNEAAAASDAVFILFDAPPDHEQDEVFKGASPKPAPPRSSADVQFSWSGATRRYRF
jgi:hypothetical protein